MSVTRWYSRPTIHGDWGIITGPPCFKRHNLVNNTVYLHENFRQYSRGNAESENYLSFGLMFFANSSLNRHQYNCSIGPTAYHYATSKVGHLAPVKCSPSAPSQTPFPVSCPLVKAYAKLPILAAYPYLAANCRNGDQCEIRNYRCG